MISSRSRLYANILDTLHDADIEIMSPNFMNTRNIEDAPLAMPSGLHVVNKPMPSPLDTAPEDIIFDKAEEAEQKERTSAQLSEDIKALNVRLKDADSDNKSIIEQQITYKNNNSSSLKPNLFKNNLTGSVWICCSFHA